MPKNKLFHLRLSQNERRALDMLATTWALNSSETLRQCLRREAARAGLPDIGFLVSAPVDQEPASESSPLCTP